MKRCFALICTLAFLGLEMQAQEHSAIEMRGDRTIIYPQQLELNGEETLMDVLQMFPELLIGGYDNLLGSYQLRLDNVAISGDDRLLMTQIKAKLLSKIQICDNSGVAKGRTGEGCVIDLSFLKFDEGGHGHTALQYATDHQLDGTSNIRYGSDDTDLFVNAQFNRTDIGGVHADQEYLHAEMTNRFSSRDILRSYVNQSYHTTNAPLPNLRKSQRQEMFMLRMRYFHTFNDIGTELLTMLTYTRDNNPMEQYAIEDNEHRIIHNDFDQPAWVVELNTPLPSLPGLTMMAGAEGGYNLQEYAINQRDTMGLIFNERSQYHIFHHDLYLQFNYRRGPMLFTLGDRVIDYYYNQDGYSGGWSKHSKRNMFQVGLVVTPHPHHQFQLAYYRKFTNPSAMDVFIELWPTTEGTFIGGAADLEETRVNQFKAAYLYSQPCFTAHAVGSYYTNSDDDKYYKVDASLTYRAGIMNVTAGYNLYSIRKAAPATSGRTTWHDLRVAPKCYLPQQWQVGAQFIWYSSDMPWRVNSYDDKPIYASLEVGKQIEKRQHIGLEWHDIFNSRLSAVIATAQWRF